MNQEDLLTYETLDRERITPMMKQYLHQKDKYPDAIIMFRLGDFYEMFFDDAISAAKALELVLTARDCGLDKKAPMCGVPHHSSASYMQRLVSAGFKVAICDQMEDPSVAKGIVRRDVTRLLTPGTVIEQSNLDEKRNNYILCIYRLGMQYGLAVTDLTTGSFEATQLVTGNTVSKLNNQIARYAPSEIICNESFVKDPYMQQILGSHNALTTIRSDRDFNSNKIAEYEPAASKNTKKAKQGSWKMETVQVLLYRSASSALLCYLEETQQGRIPHLHAIKIYNPEDTMELDAVTMRNLELTETLRGKSRKGSILWAIDRTKTSMGSRLLRRWLEQPLLNKDDILHRQKAVQQAKESFMQRQEIMEAMSGLYDLERLTSRIALNSINARDLLALRDSLRKLPAILELSEPFSAGVFEQIKADFDPMDDILLLLEESISEEPPISLKEGNILKEGYNEEIDRLRNVSQNGKSLILELEAKEKEKTGIKTMKTGYNRVFGYYLEVSKGAKDLVPEYFVRKQTLANGERYITTELKELEDSILGAVQKLTVMEYDIFCELREKVSGESVRLLRLSNALSLLDVVLSLGELAERENYSCPIIDSSDILSIEEGRHPVIEQMLPSGSFVPNDIHLNEKDRRILILTGPNMAGKSTYMRQTAIIVLLAQIGSFIPAKSAHIGIVDRIFTRIGASDDLALGQSTFMVEMNEVASILRNATRKSLLLLDEVGRGTSTYDGLSIAWAIMEYVSDPNVIFARTLFATHYHELNMLESNIQGIFNAQVQVEKKNDEVVFLHRIVDGGTDDSYGIEVAQLAGVPQEVVVRARDILLLLEQTQIKQKRILNANEQDEELSLPLNGQIDIFQQKPDFQEREDPIRIMLNEMDISAMTPLESMNILFSLIEKAKE